jgi:UDP-N-acetyl-D-glucosamine dehydrogenase
MLNSFEKRVKEHKAVVGVVGLGYVGLPLAITFARKGFKVVGLDVDPEKPRKIAAGETYLKHIPASSFVPFVKEERLCTTTDFKRAAECDAILICVPTPLTESREPDMSYIESTCKTLSKNMRPGQLVVLESTTYPGTTDDMVRGILEEGSGLSAGKDFFLVYSPEREDPGNKEYGTCNIPKVVGGYTKDCLQAGCALYSDVVDKVVPVSSSRIAEMVKLFENTYRAVNIALVNELKLLCQRMDLDIWEIIGAASTKPFGFQAFWPGPGLGGHCIPIDPFYLTWKARQVSMPTRFIELAGEINTAMPYHVVARVQEGLNLRRKSMRGSSVLVLGVAYKPNIDDMRESPGLKIIQLLQESGARVLYHDPHIPSLIPTRKYDFGLKSSPLSADLLKATDCVLVVTDHKDIDYEMVARISDLVVDTRKSVPRLNGNVMDA